MIGDITIHGQIGSFDNVKGVELIDVISQVRKQPDATGFNVFIDSEGGRVDTGFDIYNYLKSLGVPITTVGQGMVASIATVIFMAGNKRITSPDTEFMIHLPMGGIEFATASEMEEYTKQMKQAEGEIVNFYTKELGMNKESIFPLLRNETWLTNDQLKDLGFITNESTLQVAAKFKRVKSKTNKMSKKKGILEKLAKFLKDPVAKMIYSADEKEINFPDLAEDDAIEIGAKATYDGQPAEGEIVAADGKTYVFEGGVLTAINDPMEEEEMMEEEVVEALAAILEYASEIEARVEKVEKESIGLKSDNNDLKEKLAKAEKTILSLKGKSVPPKDEKKDKDDKKDTVSSIVANWKNKKKNVKSN